MSDEQPQLGDQSKLAWYQGLSKYQWFVLLIASMGWMFDTMNQQLFNVGRGPAMKEVLDVDPITTGLESIENRGKHEYSEVELQPFVDQGLLTARDVQELLTDYQGEPLEKITRNQLAEAIGHYKLRDRYIELYQEDYDAGKIERDTFDRAALNDLAEEGIISPESVDEVLVVYDDQPISKTDLMAYLGRQVAKTEADTAGDNATSIFVFGWAIGGLFFGWVGDALGRAKTMALTIVIYSVFTGLNGLAQTELQFNILRFITALGVGGEFAAGAALVAETMPDRSRPAALGTLQALSAVGNMMGAVLGFVIMPLLGWRYLFFVGAIPVVVALIVFLFLREPEKWKDARQKWLDQRAAGTTKKRASYAGLLLDGRWRGRAIVGLLLGVVGVGGLWGVGFFKPELDRLVADQYGMSPEAKERMVMIAFFLQNLGGFFGISAYTWMSLKMGRKPAFGFFFAIAFLVVSYTFLFANTKTEAYVLAPLVGFVTLGPFGGYAIYFPELFPTRLRATGVGFCYNVGRFLAALVPSVKSGLKGLFMSGAIMLPFLTPAINNAELAIRYGSFVMIFIYIIGLIVLIFAPETKDQPLPED